MMLQKAHAVPAKESAPPQRIINYDILRVVACFSIVLLHVSGGRLSDVSMNSNEFLVMMSLDSLTRFAVPVFFMLSGLFLVSPDKKNIALGKRILKLVLLFYVWSAFYGFQGIIIDALTGEFTKEFLIESIGRFISGHLHMWFLKTLLGFYILIPIAQQICASKQCLQYYLLLWVIFQFSVPCLTDLFHLQTAQSQINSLNLDILAGNFGYFLLGYYLNTTDIKKEIRRIVYALGLIAAYLTIHLSIRDSIAAGACVEKWFGPGSPNVLAMSIAIFTFFKYCKAFNSVKNPHLWEKLSGCTFFIYMFHIFVLEKLSLIGITPLSFPVAISIPVLTVFTFTVSLLSGILTEHIPIIRKIVLFH